MDNDIQYYTAVIDTSNLIFTWLKNNNDDINKILSTLEINLEAKYGPFTSKLSNQIGINETLGLKTPDSYWKGVKDTLSLIKNFMNWKQLTQSSRTIENFLQEIVNKSNNRIQPDESPLISALGISFETEFADTPIDVSSASESESNFESIITQEDSISSPPESTPVVVEDPVIDKISEVSSLEENPDKAFDPKEFIDDEKFLDQFIADSISPVTTAEPKDEPLNSDRDYLRSALEELSLPSNDNSTEKEIQIQFQDSPKSKMDQLPEKELSSVESIEEDLEEKNSSRIFSSSLRDALRMLREEE